ncbi:MULTISPECIES: RDD family protein [Bacillaceae]|uniref:RDD family protein n=1 Tax=Evansella alkalicola TaxID=745819 RepID=A0ABS6K1W9_9BACI|nr:MULTISPECIES: RDD family protein [Bacillaceae]MBU9723477.1 RDD family protein [Bacillus alkalicola]
MGDDVRYVGFWRRYLAFLIDNIFSTTLSIVAVLLSPADETVITFVLLIVVLIVFTYHIVMPSASLQATFGKYILGMKIVGLNGERITIWRSMGRLFSQFISSIMYVGYIMIAFMEKKTGLHDLIASTYVVMRD